LHVQVPRSVLAAATFVAFVAGAAETPAAAKDAGSKHSGKAASHPHRVVPHRPAPSAAPHHTAPAPAGNRMMGIASWYDRGLAGQPTASGELFDPGRLTAAHRTLPLGTRIRVTRLATGDSVVLTVNDRGPYIRGRVVDLSPAAARQLKVPVNQNTPVKIEVVSLPPLPVLAAAR
jgi:rare lipoprotein A